MVLLNLLMSMMQMRLVLLKLLVRIQVMTQIKLLQVLLKVWMNTLVMHEPLLQTTNTSCCGIRLDRFLLNPLTIIVVVVR